ncbi:carbohydrate ABC transporter permease [Microbacterium dextranolyticum]|uniref:Sugar ABC transporter permease n=1 Tax=Microbacterium dextranolyticum TaxID=36806 RepID=A0A9W6HME1_9MICO|nr:carbohydrate ABC transporter permease [Microbacterium dextranolyticum]MBM7464194.1 multiple sugar transport system permease protein [Microbacterium dextranolyticum]GLJ95188.1 sugar ABC transporter permease [Microbacterium dextranolyticum]
MSTGVMNALTVDSPVRRRGRWLANIILVVLGVVFVVPIAWIVLSSVNPAATVSMSVPSGVTFDNFAQVLTFNQSFLPLWNSAIISFGTAALTVVVGILAAYPLSRFNMRFQRGFLYSVLFGSCLPITALMVPVYAMFVQLKLLDSLLGVVLFMAATSLPMAIWMLKNFMDSVPVSLEEAAWVDGASPMRALAQIVLPLMRPGIGVVFIFVFTQAWGNFFVPFVLLFTAEKMPASVAIFQFFGNHGAVAYGQLAAFAMVYSVPILVLYLLMQRLTGSSFALAGGVKG